MMTDEKLAMMTPIDLSPEAVAKRKKEEAEAERRAEEESANQRSVVKPPPPCPSLGRKSQMSVSDAFRQKTTSVKQTKVLARDLTFEDVEVIKDAMVRLSQLLGLEVVGINTDVVDSPSAAITKEVKEDFYRDNIKDCIVDLMENLGYNIAFKEFKNRVLVRKSFFYENYLTFTGQDKDEVSMNQIGRILKSMGCCERKKANLNYWLFGVK